MVFVRFCAWFLYSVFYELFCMFFEWFYMVFVWLYGFDMVSVCFSVWLCMFMRRGLQYFVCFLYGFHMVFDILYLLHGFMWFLFVFFSHAFQ